MNLDGVALPDRLRATLEGVVMGDRWVAQRRNWPAEAFTGALTGADGDWRQGLLRVATAASQGPLLPHRWGPHFQQLPSPAATAINALPYLWIQADAQGHHRAAVAQWLTDLGLGTTEIAACTSLWATLCQVMATGAGRAATHPWQGPPGAIADPVLGPPLQVICQSQGQLGVALGVAHRRGWPGETVGLVGLLGGLTGGRSSLVASGCQADELLACPEAADPWGGAGGDRLAALATALYHRWAGIGPAATGPGTSSPGPEHLRR